MKQQFQTITILALALGLCLPARADRVRMRSGKVIEGVIAGVGGPGDGGKVRLWMGPAQISLAASQVESITTDTLGVNTLIDARFRLEGRRYEDGLEKVGLAVQQGAPTERIAALLTEHGDAIAEAIPQLSLSARDGLSLALAALANFPGAQGGGLAARRLFLHVALGEGEQGEAILNGLGKDYFAKRPAEAARLSAMLARALEGWSGAEDFASGQPVIKMLSKIDPLKAEGAAIQFYLQWGSVERRDGRYESALRIYTRNLMALSPQIARDRIAKALREAEQAIRVKGRPMEAAPLYEAYGLATIPEVARERLAQVWHDEGWARLWENRIGEARAAFAEALKHKKDCVAGCAAQDVGQCEWRERRAKLAANDFKGRFELGQWCEEKGLLAQALMEYREAMRSPEMLAQADARIQTIQSKQAEAELARIMGHYEKGEYAQVMTLVDEFMRHQQSPGFLAQAKQIKDLTDEALKLRVAQRPQQAESLYEQAQRAFYEEDYEKAQALLDTIAQHYADTVTWPKASALATLVAQKLEVAALETGRKPSRSAAAAAAATSASLARINITTGTRSIVKNFADAQPTSATRNAPVRILAPQAPRPGQAPVPGKPRTAPGKAAPAETQAISDAMRKMMQQEGTAR